MWVRTLTGPCAASSVMLGLASGAAMFWQKRRLRKNSPAGVFNWAFFTFTTVTCAAYYVCAKQHNDKLTAGEAGGGSSGGGTEQH